MVAQESNKLASHNTWSYLKPKRFWMRPFSFMARCQEVDVRQQWLAGARCFDLRVRFDKKGNPYICHGLMRYKGDVFKLLEELNDYAQEKHEVAYVRVMLEDNMFCDVEYQEAMYYPFCSKVERAASFTHIKFFGGWTKMGWRDRLIYNFGGGEPSIVEKHSSVCGNYFFSALYPKAYAKKNNEQNKASSVDPHWLMIDFMNIG